MQFLLKGRGGGGDWKKQTYINLLQHLSDMDSKKKVYMTVLPPLTYASVRAWRDIWVVILKNVSL